LRWLVPASVLGLASAATLGIVTLRPAPRPAPPASATALLSALRAGGADGGSRGYSGTLVAALSLDLPASAAALGSALPIVAMTGAHTLRYGYGGPDRQRVAVITADDELDVFRAGSLVWQWNSATKVATRSQLPGPDAAALGAPMFPTPLTYAALTPQQVAARAAAAAAGPGTTTVRVATGSPVAGRATYQVTLRPSPRTSTRIATVRIEVDTRTHVALGVQVYARGQRDPSLDVSFSTISYTTPGADYFRFAPPPGSTVRRGAQPRPVTAVDPSAAPEFAAAEVGWSAITTFSVTPGAHALAAGAAALVAPLRLVSGAWGRGYLLDTPLLCVLVTDAGQVLSGSVAPAALYAAAGN
jgi:hypothetical protein